MEANQTSKTTSLNRSEAYSSEGKTGFAFAQTSPVNFRFKLTVTSPSSYTKNLLKNIISAPE